MAFNESEAIPTKALVIYSSGHIAAHTVYAEAETFAIGAGSLLTKQSLGRVLNMTRKSLAQSRRGTGLELIPASVIHHREDALVWLRRGDQKTLWFRGEGVNYCPLPTLLFVAMGRSLHVVAVNCLREEVDQNTTLYFAPLMNINRKGALCIGSAIIPRQIGFVSIQQWEAVLLDSNFTHTNHDHTFAVVGKKKDTVSDLDHQRLWRRLSGKEVFPVEWLRPMNTTLGDWLKEIGYGQGNDSVS